MKDLRSPSHRTRTLALIACAALALALTACGGDDPGPGSSATPASDADFDPNATLRYGSPNDTSTWDPHKSGTSRDEVLLFTAYDRLMHVTPDGTFRDGLAESWSFSPDGLELTIVLRENLKFQDGTALDAAAVKANLERAKTVAGSTVAGDLAAVKTVTVVDPKTVKLTLSERNTLLPEFLSGRAGAMISPAAFDSPDLATRPVGAGMYQLKEYVRGYQAVLERWDGYWNPDNVKVQRLEIRILLDPAARVNAALANEVDVTHITTQDVKRVQATMNVNTDPTETFAHFMFDWSSPPFNSPQIRQALQYALDRDAFVRALEFGIGQPTFQSVVPKQAAFDPSLNQIYQHDVDRAKQLISESGLSGDQLTVRLLTIQGSTWHQRGAELVQGQLAAVGIPVTIRTVDRAQAGALLFGNSGEINAWFGDAGAFPSALRTMHYLYASAGGAQMAKEGLPELNQAILDGISAPDEQAAADATKKANRLAVENAVSSLPLFYRVEPSALSDKVLGWRHNASARTEFYGVGMRKG